MSFKQAAFDALDRGPTRWLIGLADSARATSRGEPAWITYDRQTGGWMKRTPGGTTLMPDRHGMGAEQCVEFTKDVFLHEYDVRRGDVVFDIGAGIGTETLPFSRMVGESGKVVAVEAHPATFAKLERVCRLNTLRNVQLIHAAVMDSNEPVTISDLDANASDLGAESYLENKIGAGGIEVPAVTIPELLADLKLDRIDFLKMNIEGAELPALRGAREALALVRHAAIGCHDFLADETGDASYRTKDAVHAILVEAGFTVTSRAGDPRPWAADYLFASR